MLYSNNTFTLPLQKDAVGSTEGWNSACWHKQHKCCLQKDHRGRGSGIGFLLRVGFRWKESCGTFQNGGTLSNKAPGLRVCTVSLGDGELISLAGAEGDCLRS